MRVRSVGGVDTRDRQGTTCLSGAKKWKRQQDDLWRELKDKCKWKVRMKVPMSQVFNTDEDIEAVLKFLEGTDVGRVSGVKEGVEENGRGGWKECI